MPPHYAIFSKFTYLTGSPILGSLWKPEVGFWFAEIFFTFHIRVWLECHCPNCCDTQTTRPRDQQVPLPVFKRLGRFGFQRYSHLLAYSCLHEVFKGSSIRIKTVKIPLIFFLSDILEFLYSQDNKRQFA